MNENKDYLSVQDIHFINSIKGGRRHDLIVKSHSKSFGVKAKMCGYKEIKINLASHIVIYQSDDKIYITSDRQIAMPYKVDYSGIFPGKWATLDLRELDTSELELGKSIFNQCNAVKVLVDNWDLSALRDANGMFGDARIGELDLSSWKLNKNIKIDYMFSNCKTEKLKMPQLELEDTFGASNCFSFAQIDSIDFSKVRLSSELRELNAAFRNGRLGNLDITKLGTKNLESMKAFCDGAIITDELDMSNLDLSSIKNMRRAFKNSKIYTLKMLNNNLKDFSLIDTAGIFEGSYIENLITDNKELYNIWDNRSTRGLMG